MPVADAPSKPSIHLLLIDDDEDDYVLTRDLLQTIPDQRFDLEWASNYESGIDLLRRNQHDLCLLDYHLGTHNGLELLVKARQQGTHVPVVIVTGNGNRTVDLEAAQQGVAYYLEKQGLNALQLERAIRYSLERASLLQALQLVNQNLEQRVTLRTKELSQTNAQLHQEIEQRREAEYQLQIVYAQEQKQSDLRAQLITTMSHEFRTPLAIIQSATEMVRIYNDRLTDEHRLEKLLDIQQQVRWMTRLLENVLTALRVEGGDESAQPTLVDIDGFCRHLIDDIKLLLLADQTLELRSNGNCGLSRTDERLLNHILTNLISNAIKFSPAGSKIAVHLLCDEAKILIKVIDQGIGIQADELEPIFEIFRRGKNVAATGGIGIGLSIVKHAVNLLHGTITVHSVPGEGSTFEVSLPREMNVNMRSN